MGQFPLISARGINLPKNLIVNLALTTYGSYEQNNLGTDIYIFGGYSNFLFGSNTGNGPVIALTLYSKDGDQLEQYHSIVTGFSCSVKNVYRCNIRLSGGNNKFFYGNATFTK
ncbi:hypothetical protein [Subdoligranulum variabile]|uniref:Uncharacterized protein n=1 Tax=Subdoligranulum variabile DSM 15176 TaxID=411471 RepID=D1PNE3_9FIRM|nr:hypothetical protein [Subdoligranulum variabile]EFB76078.1 hypothetical protein SUBVAR_05864 [Subdoligranulum variabile DSM 15176]UWP68727.1 hypothetical protein NQ490_02440 [Subdoligranulum variabile]